MSYLQTSVSFRGISNIFEILDKHMEGILGAPAHTTIKQWICKVGIYKLNKVREKTEEWFYIIDTSIQKGLTKCVVILGVKKKELIESYSPKFEQLIPLVLAPLEKSPGEVIKELLDMAMKKTGRPLAVISDEGSELKKGMALFSSENEGVKHVFDISHKLDGCLKKILNSDKIWFEFKNEAIASIQYLKLSSLAHLCPPRQRSKARMHSSFSLINWGVKVLNYLTTQESRDIPHEERMKIDWINDYHMLLVTSCSLMKISKVALDIVHQQGYYPGATERFLMESQAFLEVEQCVSYRDNVALLLMEEEQKVPVGQNYLGSSESLESVFGKFKMMEDHYSYSGFTSLVLGIPALVGTLSQSEVEQAVTSVSVYDIDRWVDENLGQTFLSQRREALQ